MGLIIGGDSKIRVKDREWYKETTHKSSRQRRKRHANKQRRQKEKNELKTEYAYI